MISALENLTSLSQFQFPTDIIKDESSPGHLAAASAASKYTEGQLAAFKTLGILTAVCYSVLLAIALYNTYFFLYK